MEQTKKHLHRILDQLLKALTTLEEALSEPKSPLAQDAAIQRFEYTFELSWKALKLLAEKEGIPCLPCW